MKSLYKILLASLLTALTYQVSAQSTTCAGMVPYCSDVGDVYASTVGTFAPAGNNYSCLGAQQGPAWYYLTMTTSGNVNMDLTAPSDIDFIIWGPFANLAAAQGGCGQMGNGGAGSAVEDCSFSGTNIESPSITGGIAGEVYVMLVTNYAGVNQTITLSGAASSGAALCCTPPVSTSPLNTSLCAGSALNVALTSNIAGSTFTWVATPNANVGGESTTVQNSSTINDPLTNATLVPQTVVYTVTPTNGCTGNPQNINVTVYPIATVNANVNVTMCSGTSITLAGVIGGGATTSTWSAPSGVFSNVNSLTSTYTPSITTGTVTLTLTTDNPVGPCLAVTDNMVVTVVTTPVMTAEPDLLFCAGAVVPINALVSVPAAATYSWTNSNVGIGLAASGTGSIPVFTATNATAAPIVATITVIPTSAAPALCAGVADVFTITVNPMATANANVDQTVCAGGTITLAGAIGGGATTSTWSAPTGAFSNVNSLTSTYTPSIASGTVTLTLTTNDPAGPCLAVTDQMIVTVNPLATTNANVDQTICAGGTITLAGAIGGGATSSTWSAPTGAFSNVNSLTSTYTPSIASGTVTLTLTTNDPAGPCLAVTDQMIVTVNPLATANANVDQTICAGGTITLAGAIGGGATTSTWSAPTGAFSNVNSLTSTYTPSIASGTVTLTLTTNDPAGPCLAVTDQMVVTVNPLATANASVDQTVCAGGTITLAGTIGGGATTSTWSAPTGAFSNVNSLTSTYTPSIASGTVTLTLTTNDPAGPCLAVTDQMIVTVNPLATANANVDQTICAGGTITLAGAIGGGATTSTWSAPTGAFSNVNSLTSTYTPSIASGTVTLTLTTNDPAGPCLAVTDQMIVTVNPVATANANVDQTICAGGTITLAGTIGGGATTSTWSAPTGAFSNVNSLTSTYTPSIGSGTVTLTLTTNDPAGPCLAVTDQMVVTVSPLPVIAVAGVNPTICGGNNGTITITGLANATNYSVSYNNPGLVGPTVMLSNGAGAITITGLTAGTYSGFSVTLNGCTSTSATVIVLVDPASPTVTDPVDQLVCAGTATAAVNFVGTAGATFNWTNNTISIGLGAAGVGNIPSFVATNITGAPVVATITVTPSLAGCTGTSQTFTITVNPPATTNANVDQTVCAGGTITLAGTIGGGATTSTWSAPTGAFSNVNSLTSTYTPSIASGTVTLTLTTNDPAGPCLAVTDQMIVTVNPLATANANVDQTICAGGTITLAGAIGGGATTSTWSAPTGAFSNVNSLTSTYTPSIGSGTVTLTLTTNDPAGPCLAVTDVMVVTVDPIATVNANVDQTICAGGTITLAGTIGGGATTSTWSAPTGAFSNVNSLTSTYTPSIGSGTVNLTLTTNDPAGPCLAVNDVMVVTVNPLPVIAVAGVNPTICGGNNGTITITGLANATNYSVSYNNPGLVGPTVMLSNGAGAITITGLTAGTYSGFSVTLNGCTSTSATVIVLVDPASPTVTDPVDQLVCAGTATAAVNFVGTAGATFNWTNNTISIGLGAAGVGNIPSFVATNITGAPVVATLTVTPTLAGCTGTSQTFTITVNPPATTNANVDQTVCAGGTITLAGAIGGGATTSTWSAPTGAFSNVNSLTSTYTPSIASGTVNVTLTTDDPAGPCTAVNDVMVVTVNPLATANANVDQTVCSGGTITLAGAIGGGATTSTWSAPTGAFSNVNSLTSTYTPSIGSGTVTLTLTTNDPAGPCLAVTDVMVVTVDPIATVNANVDQTICAGGTITLAGTIGGGATTSTWSAPTGAFSNVNSLTSTYTPSIASGTVNLTLTTNDPAGPCLAVNDVMVVTVNPVAVIAVAGVNPTTCGGNNGTITITGLANATNYSVSYNNPGLVGPTVMLSNGAGAITITGLTAGTYSGFTVVLNGCTSTSATVILLADPNPPVVGAGVDQTVCQGTAVTLTAFNPGGAAITWNNGVTNAVAFVPVVGTLTYIVTANLAGCIATDQVDVTVNPLPTVTDPIDESLCAGATTTAVNFVGTAGSTFNWTNNNATIGLAAAGVGNIPAFTALNAVPGTTVVATITVTPTLLGCLGTPQTFTISVINTLPSLNCPGNLVAVCSVTEQPPYANFAAFTGAGGTAGSIGGVIQPATFVLVSEVSNGGTCPEIFTRTYSVQDNCGSIATCTQTITVDDNINPTGTAPANINVQCIGDVPASNTALITDEADNCAPPIVTFISDVSNGLTCPQTITRTYRITDACGNFVDVTQSIIIDDTTNPTASNPALIVVPGGPAPAPNPLLVIDEADNCSVPVVAFVSDLSDGNLCPETITRTYSVTDLCGNQILVTQLIQITDPIMPTASNPAGVNVQCIALVPASNPLVVIDEADNNGVPVVVFVSDVSNGLTCPETITRTYSVTDACANQILVTQLITVDDNINPTGTAPANVAVQCIANVPVSDVALIVDEADNCALPTVTFIGDVSDGLTCPETITRTYRITDACGNFIDVTQTILVDDTTNPTASNPAGVTVECIANVPASDPTVVIDEADNCAVPTVLFVSDVSNGLTCPETITRTYSVTDACGNTINVTQTIIVDDTTNPTASNPALIVVPGGLAPAPDPLVVIDEADNCSVPLVAFVSEVTDGNPCPETITRTYSVTDLCGNQILVTQLIQITDPIMPTASNPIGVNVECIGQVPVPDILVVTDEADNNVTAPTVVFVGDVSDGNTCPEIITRTYSVTDVCGNQILVTQTITVNDITNPTAANPIAVNVECIFDVPAVDVLVVTTEADNCTAVPIVAFVSDVSDGNTCPEIITRTYSVTDDCGNTINVTQTITVNDITNPTASNPIAVNVECIGDVPATDILVVTDEADNCTAAPVVAFVSDVSDGNACPEIITRTYSVTDDCGNTINVTQTITVNDITNPTASNPADIILAGGLAPAPDILEVIDEADNCTVIPNVQFVSDVTDGNPCPETIVRTYSIDDNCGNQILVTQNIIITDPIMPTASNPVAVNVECIFNVPAPDILVVTDEADNNAAVPVVVFVGDISDGNTCPEIITRTYSVTDICGNQILVTQTITVNDITDPTASNPVAVNVECIFDVPAVDIIVVTDEADNCTVAPVVAFVSDVSDGNTCPEVITRTYSITDDCGNTINVTQTITVNDITNPTASNPIAVGVECIGDVPAADILVVTDEADNCTAIPVVAFVSDVSDGNTCPEVITRTYSVTDDCGNTINVTQTITVNDITNPTASNPAGITVAVITAVPVPDVLLVIDEADNCTVNPIVAFVSDVSDGNTCPETLTRTYSVTDDCGNTINVVQIIVVSDVVNPTASNPAPVNVECIFNVPVQDVLVVNDEADNTGIAPTVAFVSDVSDGNTCPEIITRTYSVTDACANQIIVTQIITVNDITNPTATNPVAVNVECIFNVPAVDVLVVTDEADNCTAAPIVAFVSEVSDGNTCPEIITRTYSVTDDCGNTINVTQTITVNDITNPTASNPIAVNVECIGDVPATNILVVTDEADNCTAVPIVAFVSDVSDGNTCPEVITRTYSVTDDCGNTINVVQTITVNDITLPTASNPVAVVVECIFDVPAVNILVVTDEADNCTVNPIIAFVSDVSDGNTCPEVITRTYSVTDACANQILVTQTITVNDITNPTASNPVAIVVSCASNVPPANIAVVIDEADNCTAAPIVAFVSQVSDGNVCDGEVLTRTYSVSDACGNTINVTHTITISATTAIVNAGVDQEVCDGTLITLTAANPNGAVISWNNGVIDGAAFAPPVGTTNYIVTADVCAGECISTDNVDVTINPMPVIFFAADTLIGCADFPVTFYNQSSILGNNCSWTFGDGSSTIGCDSAMHIYTTSGSFDVSLTVTTIDGCTASDSYSSYILVGDAPVAEFTYLPTYVSVENTEVQFENSSINADSYEWNFGDYLVGSYQTNPAHTFPVIGNMTYTMYLIATNSAFGCVDTAFANVFIEDVVIYYVPNVFTPDGNSINNTFFPVFSSGYDVYDYHLMIFNRWGEVLFESYDASVGWSGTYGDQGLVEDGVYVWQIEFGETMSDKRHKERGHVTVLK